MMNVWKRQYLLAYLGLYKIQIDGRSGPGTMTAIRDFQTSYGKGKLAVDGIWGPKTEARIREVIGNGEEMPDRPRPVQPAQKPVQTPAGTYPWLDLRQIPCRCGGRYCKGMPEGKTFSSTTLAWANQIGEHYGKKILITSGYRCPTWNSMQKNSSPRSQHVQARAIDLKVPGHSPEEVYDYACRLIGSRGGVGIYSWGIHIDDRGYGARWDYR